MVFEILNLNIKKNRDGSTMKNKPGLEYSPKSYNNACDHCSFRNDKTCTAQSYFSSRATDLSKFSNLKATNRPKPKDPYFSLEDYRDKLNEMKKVNNFKSIKNFIYLLKGIGCIA